MEGLGRGTWDARYMSASFIPALGNNSSYAPDSNLSRVSESRFASVLFCSSAIENTGFSMTPGPRARSRRVSNCIVQDVCSGVLRAAENISLSKMSERISREFVPQGIRNVTFAPLNTEQCLQRFNSRRSSFSGMAQGLASPRMVETDSFIVAEAVSIAAGALQPSPGGVKMILWTREPDLLGRTRSSS